MYSTKEKNKIYNDLKNQDFGEADLQLLHKVMPHYLLAKRANRDPKRYANEVLYTLLDKVSREEIRNNRREYQLQKEKENETLDPSGGDNLGDSLDNSSDSKDIIQSDNNSEDETGSDTGTDGLNPDETEDIKVIKSVKEKKSPGPTKKPEAPKSKKKKSTPKSTGETLQTETSS